MQVYIDNDYKCHVSDDGTMRAVEVPEFDGKCAAYIEGFRFVPEGDEWTRDDGEAFPGEMLSTWKDYNILAAYQEQYEYMREELADADAALSELGVAIDG